MGMDSICGQSAEEAGWQMLESAQGTELRRGHNSRTYCTRGEKELRAQPSRLHRATHNKLPLLARINYRQTRSYPEKRRTFVVTIILTDSLSRSHLP